MSEAKIRYTPGGMIDETIYEEDLVNAGEVEGPFAAEFEEPPRVEEPPKVYTKEEVLGIVHNKVKEMGEKITNSEEGEEVSDEEQEKRSKDFQKIIIVTGGAGFIGTHLIKELNHRGREDILLVDDLTDPRKLQNINTLKFQDYVDKSKFIELLSFLLENKMVERIYHLGAESSRFCTDGKYLMENNYQYTCNIMDHCHMYKIPLVFASSASIYGQSETFDDTSDDYTPESYYALSKLQADRYSRKFVTLDQDIIIGLRYFNVFSEGEHEQHKDDMKSALCWMTEQYKKEGVIKLFEGSKEIKRDFVHVTNAVEMTINAMTKGKTGIYNIGSEESKTFYDMAADVLEKEFSTDESNIKFIPMPEDIAQGYQKSTKANMSNACFGITTRP
jgi:ADP-L-glycero-D-manno-heptose 6-epimerase